MVIDQFNTTFRFLFLREQAVLFLRKAIFPCFSQAFLIRSDKLPNFAFQGGFEWLENFLVSIFLLPLWNKTVITLKNFDKIVLMGSGSSRFMANLRAD